MLLNSLSHYWVSGSHYAWIGMEFEMEPICHPFIWEFLVGHSWLFSELFWNLFPKLWYRMISKTFTYEKISIPAKEKAMHKHPGTCIGSLWTHQWVHSDLLRASVCSSTTVPVFSWELLCMFSIVVAAVFIPMSRLLSSLDVALIYEIFSDLSFILSSTSC